MEDVPERHDFPAAEEAVLKHWEKIDAFKTSLKRNEGKPRYSFYDGPPFATGTPHYGHILAGTIKDTVTRYAAQNGFYVERRFVIILTGHDSRIIASLFAPIPSSSSC